jgi:membrane protein
MRARIGRLVQRAQQTAPLRVIKAFGESQASSYALAIAFAGFMSMFPMILGALSLVGLAVRNPQTEAHFQTLILQVFPSTAQPELERALNGVKQSAGWLGLISIGGLIWSASSIFGTMEFALSEIFGTKQRDMLRQKAMGFFMMLILVAAIGLTVVINAMAAFLPLAGIASLVVGAAVMVGLLVALYRLVPNRTFGVRDVLPGALLAGSMIEVLSLAFPLYARIAGGFNTYGAQFALFFLLATWFYLLSELILFGAIFNRFRLGEPTARGLFASPMHEARQSKRPVEVIKQGQEDGARTEQQEAAESPPPRTSRSLFQRVALGLAVAVTAAGGVIRRRRKIST